MKRCLLIFCLISFTNLRVKSQTFLGKTYIDVHKEFKSLKGENLYNFIELEPNTLNYGYKNDEKKLKIYKYSAIFNDNNICIFELWLGFNTKEEALTTLQKSTLNKKLEYIQTTDEEGDLYLIISGNNRILANIAYANVGYKEYTVSFKYYNE